MVTEGVRTIRGGLLPRATWVSAGVMVLGLALGCPRPSTSSTSSASPAGSTSTAFVLGPSFVARQRVTTTFRGRAHVLDVVLQVREGVLTLVGLSPFGARLFSVVQRGATLEVDVSVPGALPVPAERIVADLRRAIFVRLDTPPVSRRGRRQGLVDGERVVEHWTRGRVTQRRFFALERGRWVEALRVAYPAGLVPGELPATLRLEHRQVGLVVAVETLSARALPAGR